MWARRLGVPHLWPSRVKVFFLGLMTSVVIFSVFQYLHGANVEYLDLNRPVSRSIVCRLPRAECLSDEDPVRCTVLLEDRRIWKDLNLTHPCPFSLPAVGGRTCSNPLLPLAHITGELGSLRTVNGVNPFQLWSILFLILTSLLSVSVVIHDLALLEESLRPSILSIPNMKYATPCLWEWLSCVQCRKRMLKLRRQHRCLWTVAVPVWTICQVLAFMVVLYPVALAVYLLAPVKMSRIMVFLSAILCMLWSIIFVIETAVNNQEYAVLWGAREPTTGTNCVCLCEFFLSRSVILRVVVLGSAVCLNAFNLTFRALRGLRRAQWANMFSVLYSVPIEAFPVFWERPGEVGGPPIMHRAIGEAVQSEPAFDPFCLMDEQPESAWTRAQIKPVIWTEQQQFLWEPYAGTLDTEIGCCGFPQPTHSQWERGSDDGVEDGKTDMESESDVGNSRRSRSSVGRAVALGRLTEDLEADGQPPSPSASSGPSSPYAWGRRPRPALSNGALAEEDDGHAHAGASPSEADAANLPLRPWREPSRQGSSQTRARSTPSVVGRRRGGGDWQIVAVGDLGDIELGAAPEARRAATRLPAAYGRRPPPLHPPPRPSRGRAPANSAPRPAVLGAAQPAGGGGFGGATL